MQRDPTPTAEAVPSAPWQLGVHDLGGAPGWGAVPHDPDEPPFHADWERRVFGLLGAVTANVARRPGEFRYALERLDPADYFDNGYFGRWLAGFELLLAEGSVAEPESGSPANRATPPAERDPRLLPADRPTPTPEGRTVRRDLAEPPRFAVGDRVVAPAPLQVGHTRLPGYAVGKVGTVAKMHPAEVLPDSTAHGQGERPQHVCCVAYDARELWGDEAEPNATVYVDLYESYLTPADEPEAEDY